MQSDSARVRIEEWAKIGGRTRHRKGLGDLRSRVVGGWRCKDGGDGL